MNEIGGNQAEEHEPPPPWIALPDLSPDDPATQGVAEAYIDLTFLPFWTSLTTEEKASYLDRWSASPEWREAIALKYDHVGFDVKADAEEAATWRVAHPLPSDAGPPWWAFWKQ